MRVALCLSGGCFGLRESYEGFKKFWIEPFETDVFIHTYDHLTTRRWEIPCDPVDFSDMASFYKPVKMVVQNWKKMKPIFDIHKYDGKKHSSTHIPSTLSMFYNIFKCNQLKSEYEQMMGFKYDLVIRSRFDLVFSAVNNTPYLDRDESKVYIPWRDGSGNFSGDKTPFLYGGLVDQFAIGTSSVMDKYSDVYPNVDTMINAGGVFHPETLLKQWVTANVGLHPTSIDVTMNFIGVPEYCSAKLREHPEYYL